MAETDLKPIVDGAKSVGRFFSWLFHNHEYKEIGQFKKLECTKCQKRIMVKQ